MSNQFPKHNRSKQKGNEGVNILQNMIENEFGWLLRRVPQEYDYGIDGYIDIISKESYVTGKMFAVQVKCGVSYFKDKTDIGFIFKGEAKHLNYYQNIQVPVLLTIINPENGKIYFTEFDISHTFKRGNGWAIIIPYKNVMDLDARDFLYRMVGVSVDYSSQVDNLWKRKALLNDVGFFMLLVDKIDIEEKNYTPFLEMFEMIEEDPKYLVELKGKVNFMIDGYDKDTRELYEIKEVREWVQEIFKRINSWAYFLSFSSLHSGFGILYACTSEIKNITRLGTKNYVEFEDESLGEFVQKVFLGLNLFTKEKGIPLEVNKEQSMKFSDYIESFLSD